MHAAQPSLNGPRRAFTLTEVLVTSALLIMVILGIIGGHLFGLRMLQLIERATLSNEGDRRLLRQLEDDMASASYWELGSANASSFTRLSLNRLQRANGLQLYNANAGGATNQFARYYLSASLDKLHRVTSSNATVSVLATNIINSRIFSMEDAYGNIVSNRLQHPVLGITIQFRDTPRRAWGIASDNETHWLRSRLKNRTTE